jgi:hypothetical protein
MSSAPSSGWRLISDTSLSLDVGYLSKTFNGWRFHRKPKRTKKNEQTERDKRNSMKSLILDKMKNLQVKSHLVNQTMLSSFRNRTNL